MINRELIRIKIVQLIYAYYQNGNKNIDTAEKELFFSLSKSYDMYNYLLGLMVSVTKEARKHLEIAQAKARREGTAEPSARFALNRFAMQLEDNTMLNDFMSTQKKTWNDEPEFIKKLYNMIVSSEIYREYMENPDDSYEVEEQMGQSRTSGLAVGSEGGKVGCCCSANVFSHDEGYAEVNGQHACGAQEDGDGHDGS